MGRFITVGDGGSARESLDEARLDAAAFMGEGRGISAKRAFLMATSEVLATSEAEDLALRLARDSRFADDNGPAGCIRLDDSGYFFDWAPRR